MIAAATSRPRRAKSATGRPDPIASRGRVAPERPAAEGDARQALRERRAAFFARPIDYIPCKLFLRADAEALATRPPADASEPLEFDVADTEATRGLTPYLASLYRTRLLSKDEEQFYFRRMNWLKFRAAAARGRLDTRRATLRQIEQVEGLLTEAETVKSILITANLRLVVSIAKKFVDANYSFEELVSEGNVALIRSVEKFNFALGNRFSTYATYAIQRHFFRLSQRGRQLRKRFVCDDDSLRGTADDDTPSPYRSSEQIELLQKFFAGFLGELEPRERQIVRARFGFDGQPPRTFRQLGSQMGVCKERIRQIQSRAIDKLRGMAGEAGLDLIVGDWL